VLLHLHLAGSSSLRCCRPGATTPNSSTFRPKLPRYKHKTAGRTLLVSEWEAIGERELDRGVNALSGLGELVQTRQTRKTVDQVRIVPQAG
jgi:hypothetical protein